MKNKIIVVTPFYKREEVFKLFLKNLNYLRNNNINLNAILIGSDSIKNEKQLVENNGFIYLNHKNQPLSNKWNWGTQYLKNIDFEYCIILGSDDLISYNLLNRLIKIMDVNDYDVVGLLDIYFYELISKSGVYWPGYDKDNLRFGESIGAGRIYKKSLLEEFNYKLWYDYKNKSLDKNISERLMLGKKKVHVTKMLKNEYLIDIKGGDEQITPFDNFKNHKPVELSNIIDSLTK